MTFKRLIRFLFYIACLILSLNVIKFGDDNLYADSICQLNDNDEEKGICKFLDECEISKINLVKFNIKPKICSFNRNNPIICCKINQTENFEVINDTNVQLDLDVRMDEENRISQKKCKNLYDSEIRKVYGKRRRTKRATMTTISYNNETSSHIPVTTPIAGGKPVLYKQYPFMVAIGWEDFDGGIEFKCGGTLIERNFVVTAAHCADIGGAKPKVIRTGGVDLNKNYLTNDDILVKDIFIHPNYTKDQTYNDIALIQLTTESLDNPACLYPRHEIPDKFQYAIAIGYGQIQFAGPSSKVLLQIQIDLIENKICKNYYVADEKYPNSIIDTQICAFDPKQIKDTCPGDSGGPMFLEENIPTHKKVNIIYLLGVTSFGKFCASDSPGVYTRISSYLDWIESIVWVDEMTKF